MKKILSAVLAGLVIAGTMAMGAAAADPTLLWDFGEDGAMDASMQSPTTLEWYGEKDGEDDYYVFTTTGNDPNVQIHTPVADASQVTWAKIRIKNTSPATAVELFGATGGRSLTGSECTHFEIEANSNEWKSYVIYIPDENVKTVNAYKDPQYAITEPYWAGTVEFIRLDPMWQEGDDGSDAGGNMTSGDTVMIDYVAFFDNEADARAFREPVVVEPETEAETVAEVVEAPAAPQTFDAGIIAAVAAVVAAAGYAVSKKR